MFKIFNWKYRYFNAKLRGVEKMIEDLKFKRFKTLEIREEIRQTYDQSKSRFNILEAQIKVQKDKPTMEEGDIKKMDDQIVLLEKDIKRYEEQMKALDSEVFGRKPDQEDHEGMQGINEQIDALYELKGMVNNYFKEL